MASVKTVNTEQLDSVNTRETYLVQNKTLRVHFPSDFNAQDTWAAIFWNSEAFFWKTVKGIQMCRSFLNKSSKFYWLYCLWRRTIWSREWAATPLLAAGGLLVGCAWLAVCGFERRAKKCMMWKKSNDWIVIRDYHNWIIIFTVLMLHLLAHSSDQLQLNFVIAEVRGQQSSLIYIWGTRIKNKWHHYRHHSFYYDKCFPHL